MDGGKLAPPGKGLAGLAPPRRSAIPSLPSSNGKAGVFLSVTALGQWGKAEQK